MTASRTPEVFISGPGVTTPRPPRWVRLAFGDSMVNLDDPRHARLRGVVAKSFTPRVVARIFDDVSRVAADIVDDVLARRPDDFVGAVASRLPFEVICAMMGIPENVPPGGARPGRPLDRTARAGGVCACPGRTCARWPACSAWSAGSAGSGGASRPTT